MAPTGLGGERLGLDQGHRVTETFGEANQDGAGRALMADVVASCFLRCFLSTCGILWAYGVP